MANVTTNTEYEDALLGAILMDNRIIEEHAIQSRYFSASRAQEVFRAIQETMGKGATANIVEVARTLPSQAAYIAHLTDGILSSSGAAYYVKELRNLAQKREIVRLSRQMAEMVSDDENSAEEIIGACDRGLMEVAMSSERGYRHVSEIIPGTIAEIESAYEHRGGLSGIDTGFLDLNARTGGFQKQWMVVIGARPGAGKAQPLYSKIKTVNGWTTMRDIKMGDALASIDGGKSIVDGIYPQGVKKIYRVTFSDGRMADCTGEHLWRVMYREWDAPRILSTDDVIEKLKYKRYKGRIWIDLPCGEYGCGELPLDPWLLGFLIGDGCFTGEGLMFSTSDKEIIDKIKDIIGDDMIIKYAGKYDYRIRRKDKTIGKNIIKQRLKELGLWGCDSFTKFIPDIYKNASMKDRLSLLNGLIASDGDIGKQGYINYCTVSTHLADDVSELVRSLGGVAPVNSRITRYTYKGKKLYGARSYRVSVCVNTEIKKQILFLERHYERINHNRKGNNRLTISNIEYIGDYEAQCIHVTHPSHLYITDNYVVTHNTACALNMITAALKQGKSVGLFSAEMSAESIMKRFFADWGNTDHRSMVTGFVDNSVLDKINEAASQLVEKRLYINDKANIPLNELVAEAYRMKRREGIDIAFVDYLSLVSNKSKAPRHEQVAEISQALKGLARTLDIPIIALSQLNRESQDERPKMSHLRDSGCLAGNTIIHRPESMPELRSLDTVGGFPIYSYNGGEVLNMAKKCFSTGEKRTYTLRLSTGHEIRATGNHRFMAVGEKWMRLDELKVGDLVGLIVGDENGKNKTMTDDEIKSLGLFIGNGCFLPRRSIQFTANSLDDDLCDEIAIMANRICNGELRPYKKNEIFRKGTDKESSAMVVYFPSKRVPSRGYHNPLIAWLDKFGLYGKRAKEKTIPVELFSQPIESKRLFLRYLWATDGTVGYSEGIKKTVNISYSTTSQVLARQVQSLLQSVGIISTINKKNGRGFEWYNVEIYSRYFKKIFMDEVGIAGKRKGDILVFCKEKNNAVDPGWTKYELSENRKICYIPIKEISEYGIEQVYDIEVPGTHNFIANGFIVHNSVEQDADMIILLWNKGSKTPDDPKKDVTMIVSKHRHGPTGEKDMVFHATRMRFFDIENS